MSKYVKDLVAKEIAGRLNGVDDALLVNVVGLDANKTVVLRKQLREKDIHLMAVKNSLAKRATEGTPLAAAFECIEGTLAMV
jgi:ribosomal protein L10